MLAIRSRVWGCAALLEALTVAVGVLHVRDNRDRVREEAGRELEMFIQNAEGSVNRNLLQADLVLAAQAAAMEEAANAGASTDAPAVGRQLRRVVDQNLLLRDVALLDEQDRVIFAAREATTRLGVALPKGFLAGTLALGFPTLHVSTPTLNPATSESSIWLARPLTLPHGRVALVVELPVTMLASLLGTNARRDAWTMPIELVDGTLMATAPYHEPRLGTRLVPPLVAAQADGNVRVARGRLDDQASLMVSRPALYPQLMISAGVPLATLEREAAANLTGYTQAAVALMLLLLLLLALAGVLDWHLRQQAAARTELEAAQRRLQGSHADLQQQVRERERADAERAQTRALMAGLLAHTLEGFWHIDTEALTIDANSAMCALMGRPREQIVGRSIFDFVDEANAEVFRRQMALRRQDRGGSCEVSLRRPDGSVVPCINSATPIYDEQGVRTSSVGLWTDVTSMVATQRELATAKATLDRALDSMIEGFVLYDRDERLVSFNSRYLELFPHLLGVLHKGVEWRTALDAIAEHHLPKGTSTERAAWIAARRAYPRDHRPHEQTLPGGRVVEITERTTLDGGFVGVVRDVTAQRQFQRELESAKSTLDQALDAMSDGFVIFDANQRLRVWNQRYVELLPYLQGRIEAGMTLAEVGDIAARALFPNGSAAQRDAFIAKRRLERLRGSESSDATTYAGRSVQAIDRRTSDGKLVSVFRDVTQEHNAARAMADARDATQAAASAKSRFLASMSHEIRTPLNAVLGMNGLLMETALDADQRRYVDLIGKSGENLLALINDILDLSRLESGKLTLEVVDFSLAAAVHDVVSMMSVRAQAKALTMSLHPQPGADVPAVRGDPSRLRQVLFNLLGNAVKFTESGRIDVDLGHAVRPDGQVAVSLAVRDTGIGIEPHLLPGLFERFQQADSSMSRRFGGSGLGLSICREIVQLMGGTIQVDSEPGRGSSFRVELVLERARGALALTGFDQARPAPVTTRALRVLVAEDNSVNQILIAELLTRLGHHHDIVADGVEAVRQVQAAPYDLVLMDVQMPQMDGIEATHAIRSLKGAVSQVSIIAMTANVMAEDRAACFRAGMMGFIGKPIDRSLLHEVIEQAARGALSMGPPEHEQRAT